MAVIQASTSKGRDFTAEELIGRRVRFEAPVKSKKIPMGYELLVIADDEAVNNVSKIVLTLKPDAVIEAIVTLYRFDLVTKNMVSTPIEEVVLRDNLEVSFSAIVSEIYL